MRSKIAMLASLLAATLALPSQARAPEQTTGWLLLAQSEQATCQLDGRKVPLGTTYCREGYVVKCNRSGNWERTSKRC